MVILTRQQAAAMAGIHERTLDRLHTLGEGPPRIQLTRRRCGYERGQFEAWLTSRAFASQAAALAAGATVAAPPRHPQNRKRVQ
jgi:hypothetical protein